MANDPHQKQRKPLAGSALSPSVFGQSLTPPPSPTFSGNLQQDQNAANNANNQRYGQGLGVLTGGLGATQQSIQQAINSSQSYGQANAQKLGLQLQQSLGQQAQSAAGRGLTNTTIADTMKDLPTRQYNDAIAQNTEMAANRMSGLYLNQANANTQGAGSIASYIASRNDQAPDMGAYTKLAQNAASAPQKHTISTMSGGAPSPGGWIGSGGSMGGNAPPPPGASSGGGGSSGGAGGYITGSPGSGPGSPAPYSQGYTGTTQAPQDGGASQSMTGAGYAPGSISITPSGVGAGKPMAASGPPAPIAPAASPAPGGPPAPLAAAKRGNCRPGFDDGKGGCAPDASGRPAVA